MPDVNSIYCKSKSQTCTINSGTINPGGTRKPDNPLKGIRNPILRNPDSPIKEI